MNTVNKSFEVSMSEDLMNYQPIVKGWLQKRFPTLYSESLAFDCHSNGMLNVLQLGYTGLQPSEVHSEIFKGAIKHLSNTTQHMRINDRAVNDPQYYHPECVDFAKLDQRFANSLSTFRRRIWNMRVEGLTMKQISEQLGSTVNVVNVTCYNLRQSYAEWLKMMYSARDVKVEALPDRPHYREAFTLRYHEGYSPAAVANFLNLTVNYAYQILYKLREALKERGVLINY
jgi:DNA-directed RNA polymerase specialized sigma24 family protein